MKYFLSNPPNNKTIRRKQIDADLQYLKKWLESQLKAWSEQKDSISTENKYGLLEKYIAKGRVFELEDILYKVEQMMDKRF